MKVLGIFLLLFGLAIAGASGYHLYKTIDLRNNGSKADGKVLRLDTHISKSRDKKNRTKKTTMYTPVVSFIDENGTEHSFKSDVSSSSPGYSVGEVVPVYYPANHPEDATLATTSGYVLMGIGIFLGLIVLVIANFILFSPRKKS